METWKIIARISALKSLEDWQEDELWEYEDEVEGLKNMYLEAIEDADPTMLSEIDLQFLEDNR